MVHVFESDFVNHLLFDGDVSSSQRLSQLAFSQRLGCTLSCTVHKILSVPVEQLCRCDRGCVRCN